MNPLGIQAMATHELQQNLVGQKIMLCMQTTHLLSAKVSLSHLDS